MVVEYELVFTTLRFTARCESCDGTIAFGVADPSETLLSGVAFVGWRRGCASANHVAKYDVDPDEWVIAGEGPRVDAATRRAVDGATIEEAVGGGLALALDLDLLDQSTGLGIFGGGVPTTVRFFAAASEAPEVMPDLDAADAVTVELVSATVEEASADDDGVIALSPPRSPPPSPPPPPEAGACGTHGTPSPLASHRCMVRLAEGVLLHYSLETRELNVTIECECDVCADGITLAFATEAGRVAGAVAIVSDGGGTAVVCEDSPTRCNLRDIASFDVRVKTSPSEGGLPKDLRVLHAGRRGGGHLADVRFERSSHGQRVQRQRVGGRSFPGRYRVGRRASRRRGRRDGRPALAQLQPAAPL